MELKDFVYIGYDLKVLFLKLIQLEFEGIQ